jgi:hypothetical protein
MASIGEDFRSSELVIQDGLELTRASNHPNLSFKDGLDR